MEKREIIKHSERLAFWVIILSIVSLVLISLLPWVSITETDAVEDELVFNFEMMSKSNNLALQDLATQLNLVNDMLWTLIILGLVALVGATILSSGKYVFFGQVLMMVGCVTIISSILILNIQLSFYQTIEENFIISSAEIFPHIKYSFIPLIFSIIVFILSAVYVVLIVLHLVDKIKNIIKKSKQSNNINPNIEKLSLEPKKDEGDSEIEKMFAEKFHKNINEEEQEETIEQEKDIKPDEKPKSPFKEEKVPENKIQENKTEEKIQEKSDISPTDKEIEKIPSDLKDQKKGIPLTVRCPQCKYVFPTEKKGNEIKIECPKCGKTGTIKS